MPVRRPGVVPRLADERASDDAADRVLARQYPAGDTAGVVELLERDRLLVRGDLEDGVGARVDDPLPRPLVLLAELLDDLRAARRDVPEDAVARFVHERVDHVVREAVRVGRHRLLRLDPHQLPVAGRRVLAARALERAARRPRARPAAAGSRAAARCSRGRAPRASAGRARRPPAPRSRACPSPGRRSRPRRAARRLRPHPAR